MLDPNLFTDDYNNTKTALLRKGVEPKAIEEARDSIINRRKASQELEALQAEVNKASKQIGDLMRTGERDKAEALKKEISQHKITLQEKENLKREAEEKSRLALFEIPNLPLADVPEGLTEEQNIVIRHEGYDEAAMQSKESLPHWDIADKLGILDNQRAVKLSGSMFSVLRGDGAKLLRSLVQFALDLHGTKYEELVVPHFVRTSTLESTGHLPKFADDAFHMPKDDLWAIPTGEVPLTAFHADEILALEDLPTRYMTYTSCFRREAGSAGKETRGLQRLHEFHKVELVQLVAPENGLAAFADLLGDCEKTLKELQLPYRVLDLCAGDLTFSSAKMHDLEVFSPGVQRWLECSSVGLFTDFQMRRGAIRFRRSKKDKPEFAYSLNGSGIATPRIIASILENGWQADGTVKLPEVLHDYMNKTHLG